MGYKVQLSKLAQKDLAALSPDIARRILKKLFYFSNTSNLLQFAKRLTDPTLGEYRFRMEDYRALVDVNENVITVLRIGHRKEIYDL